MAKSPKSPASKSASRTPNSKASKPLVQPLDEHLAALLNPVLNERREGFGEAPQAKFDISEITNSDPKLLKKLKAKEAEASHPRGLSGASATAESLQSLLEAGDPNLRDHISWTPHRPDRPPKSEGWVKFKIVSEYESTGDQPNAIKELVAGISAHERDQVLLGVTGSGKTFTMAQVIEKTNRPALILAPNKTLAAQLYGCLLYTSRCV